MNLFLDTSQTKCNIALFKDKKIVASISIPTKNNMTDVVVEEIDFFLKKNKVSKDEIKNFFFTTGPGSFTGVRVTTLIAKSWNLIKNVSLFYIDSLTLQVPKGISGVSLLDAKGNKFYFAKVCFLNKRISRAKLLTKNEIEKHTIGKKVFKDFNDSDIFDNLILNLSSFRKCRNIDRLKCFYVKGPVNANN